MGYIADEFNLQNEEIIDKEKKDDKEADKEEPKERPDSARDEDEGNHEVDDDYSKLSQLDLELLAKLSDIDEIKSKLQTKYA